MGPTWHSTVPGLQADISSSSGEQLPGDPVLHLHILSYLFPALTQWHILAFCLRRLLLLLGIILEFLSWQNVDKPEPESDKIWCWENLLIALSRERLVDTKLAGMWEQMAWGGQEAVETQHKRIFSMALLWTDFKKSC